MAEGDVLIDADPATLRRLADALDALAAREWGGVADASNVVYHLAERMPAGPPRVALETHLSSWRDFYYTPDDAGSRWLLRTVALGLRAQALVVEQGPHISRNCGCILCQRARREAWVLLQDYVKGTTDAQT